MLPFSLKAVWFSLSIAGMIYNMNPFQMPYGFCASQLFAMGLGVFLMTGTASTFAIATTYASYKPKIWKIGRQGRIYKTNKHIERSRDSDTRPKNTPKALISSVQPTIPRETPNPLDVNRESNDFSIQTVLGRLSSSSEVSQHSSFPTFADMHGKGTMPVDADGTNYVAGPSKESWRDILQQSESDRTGPDDDGDKMDTLSWKVADDDEAFEYGKGDIELVMSDGASDFSIQNPTSRRFGLSLASLTTIIDMAKHRSSPSPFGTQHVAMLLSAWAPAFIFAQREDMRKCAARITGCVWK
ncbi:hypothetical protein H0H92_009502 [Tricholoma furcatifolium]|nr:hypothetical protein H0H92_009502 [Tricholoma furcatifolium]